MFLSHRSLALALFAVIFAGCKEPAVAPAAPAPVAVSVTSPPPPAGRTMLRFVLDATGKTSIDMLAPKEHIKADTTAAKGELSVDPSDLTKTRGQVKVDLSTLTTHTFGDTEKDSAQTGHARIWLEAGDLVAPEVREANRWVTYTVRSVDGVSATDLAAVPVTHLASDDARAVDATVKGDFFLHGHAVPKDVPVTVTFHYPTGQASSALPTRVEIHTRTPLHVALADHDVKPRDGLGKLAEAAFGLLGTKVAETADVTLDLSASPAL